MTEDTRSVIHRYIIENPGIYFSGLVRRLDLAPGQVQYHTKQLRRANGIVREEFYGRTHYYPPSVNEPDRGVLALAHRETSREIVVDLLEYAPARPANVADRVGIARSTLEWHLARFEAEAIMTKHRDSRNRVTLELDDPAHTIALLETVSPRISGRFVDRFERLVDHILTP